MNDLVFVESQKLDTIPFTTSEVIAGYAQVQHHTVTRLIQKHQAALEQFGLLGFKIDAVKKARGVKYIKTYHLNEEQATLLITFLQNTEPVVKFKTELVRQFYLMKTELLKRQIQKTGLKPVRREMTDVIQEVTDSQWSYKLFTDLSYKLAVGKTAVKLREERGAPRKAVAVDYMTAEEIAAVSKMQNRIAVLLETGLDYATVKQVLQSRFALSA